MKVPNRHRIVWLIVLIASLSVVRATPPSLADSNPSPNVVYETDFSRDPGPEWSQTNLSITHKDNLPFLGPFSEDPLLFTIANLPQHQFIRLRFKLLTYQPWTGDSQSYGRDLWDLRVVHGQPLIHTTFSDCGYFTDNNEQSFPDQYPWYPTHPGWTGADSKQTLGYGFVYPFATGGRSRDTDSTYSFDLTFPHTDASLQLQFKSLTKFHQFKAYGFLSFAVETVDHAAPADDQSLAQWWDDLANEDPTIAYHAVWSMIATGDAATKYIDANLPPVDADDPYPLNIDQTKLCDRDKFTLSTPEARREARAIHVLEVINSKDARALLKTIGFQGTPESAPPDQSMQANDKDFQFAQDLQRHDPDRVAAAVDHFCQEIQDHQSDYCVDQLLKAKKFTDVDAACQAAILAHADTPYWVSRLQLARTKALLGQGKYDEALSAAKAYYNVCLLPETDGAVDLVAHCLTLARPDGKQLAARFRRQQYAWSDPDYTPDPAHPQGNEELGSPILSTIKIDPKPYQDALKAIDSDQYPQLIAKADLLLLSDNPTDAKTTLDQAMNSADDSQKSDAAQNLAASLRSQSGCLGPALNYLFSSPDTPNPQN